LVGVGNDVALGAAVFEGVVVGVRLESGEGSGGGVGDEDIISVGLDDTLGVGLVAIVGEGGVEVETSLELVGVHEGDGATVSVGGWSSWSGAARTGSTSSFRAKSASRKKQDPTHKRPRAGQARTFGRVTFSPYDPSVTSLS
jgi:hypothetical protein